MKARRNLPEPAAPPPLAWERQPREPVRAFGYFAEYRDLGPHRSIAKVARHHRKSIATLNEMSQKRGWVARAEAYDDYVDRRLRDERETELLRAERQEAAVGRRMTALGSVRFFGRDAGVDASGNPVEPIEPIDPAELDAISAATLIEKGIRIRRLAQGQPTDVLKGIHSISAADLIRAVEGIYEIAQRFIPEERQPRFASEVQLFVETGRLPWQDR